MKLFSGTSNIALARMVSDALDIPLGKAEVTRFIDNECRVFVKEDIQGEDVFVIQSLSEVADQNLVELCLFGSALHDLHAKSVTAVIPWLGYSKQDKAFRRGEAVSAQLVAKFIEAAGFTGVITCQLHSEQVIPYFTVPMTELHTHDLLLSELRAELGDLNTFVVVSPDTGGKTRSELFAKVAGLPIVYLDKSRNLDTGEVTVHGISDSVRTKDVIIFDDIINTGSTAIKTSEFVKQQGARSVCFLATHAVLAGNASGSLSQSVIDRVIVTDTIAIPDSKKFDALTVLSVKQLLSDAITKYTR